MQQQYIVSHSDVMKCLFKTYQKFPHEGGAEWGYYYINDIDRILKINFLHRHKYIRVGYISMPRVMEQIHRFETNKLIGNANRALYFWKDLIKKNRVIISS